MCAFLTVVTKIAAAGHREPRYACAVSDIRSALSVMCRRVLHPLVRILVRFGVSAVARGPIVFLCSHGLLTLLYFAVPVREKEKIGR